MAGSGRSLFIRRDKFTRPIDELRAWCVDIRAILSDHPLNIPYTPDDTIHTSDDGKSITIGTGPLSESSEGAVSTR